MFTPHYTTAFKKDFKRIGKRGFDIDKLNEVVRLLIISGYVPSEKFKTTTTSSS